MESGFLIANNNKLHIFKQINFFNFQLLLDKLLLDKDLNV